MNVNDTPSHVQAPYGASRSAASMQVRLFPRRKAGEPRNSLPRGRAPLKVDGHAIQSLFDRPQGEAAKQLGISTTAMKQLCRKFGIVRWPYSRQKKEESARTAARKARAVKGYRPAGGGPNMDAFEPAQALHSGVSSASTDMCECADSSQREDSQSLLSTPRKCGAHVRLSADHLSLHMADLDRMAQAQKISPLAVVRAPAGPTFPQPAPPRSNAHWIPAPCGRQWPSVAHHEARARPRDDAVDQAAAQLLAYVKEYVDPTYSDAAGPQHLPCHVVLRDDVPKSYVAEEDDDLAWLLSFEKPNPCTAWAADCCLRDRPSGALGP